MDAIWRKARHGRTVHAYPSFSVFELPLCSTTVRGPWFNEYPAPPAELRRARYCRRCQSALRRCA